MPLPAVLRAAGLQQMDEQVSVVMWRLDRVPERQIAHLARIGPHPDYSRRKVVEAAQALWQEVASRRTASGAATRLPLPFNCYIKRCALQGLRLVRKACSARGLQHPRTLSSLLAEREWWIGTTWCYAA